MPACHACVTTATLGFAHAPARRAPVAQCHGRVRAERHPMKEQDQRRALRDARRHKGGGNGLLARIWTGHAAGGWDIAGVRPAKEKNEVGAKGGTRTRTCTFFCAGFRGLVRLMLSLSSTRRR